MIGTARIKDRAVLWYEMHVVSPILFASESIADINSVGSIFPSSAPLRRKMLLAGIDKRSHLKLVVLHGVGCGEFLFELFRVMKEGNVRVDKCVIMDINPRFIKRSSALLPHMRKIFGGETEIRFELMDALLTPAYLRENSLPQADLIIGTLPYTNMPERTEKWSDMYAEATSYFVFYTYANIFKKNICKKTTPIFINSLGARFKDIRRSRLLFRNIPPVYAVLVKN